MKTAAVRMMFFALTLASASFTAAVWPPAVAAEVAPVVLELKQPISVEKFHKIARRAYARRNWTVGEAQGNVVSGTLERKGITFKAEMELKADVIVVRFVPGFADKRQNYLSNLRLDLEFELTNE